MWRIAATRPELPFAAPRDKSFTSQPFMAKPGKTIMRAMVKFCVVLTLILVTGSVQHVRAADAPDGTTFTHTVLSVDGPDLLRIKYCGMPLQVKLANVQSKGGDSEAQSLKYLREILHPGTVIRIEMEPELNADGNAMPAPVQLFVGNTHVNVEMLKRGFGITDGRSKKYASAIQTAQSDAMTAKAGLWAPGAAVAVTSTPDKTSTAPASKQPEIDVAPADYKGPVVADLNSKEYHLPGSRFAKSIRAAAKIEYKSFEEAERAGKMPSPFSFPDRAKSLAEKVVAAQSAKAGGGAPQSTDQVVADSKKALSDALQFMGEARKASHNDNSTANANWKKAAKILNESLDKLTPVADANPNNADIQKLAEDMTMNLYSCNKYQSL